MAKFILRRLLLMLLTMLLVSIAVFVISEAAPGNIARNVLGHQITPEQEAAFLAQNGLDKPLHQRYYSWLLGSDWQASAKLGLPLQRVSSEEGFWEWWAVLEDGSLARWELEGEDLIVQLLLPDGSMEEVVDNERWQVADPASEIERLEEHRTAILESPQLAEEDRQAIVTELDALLDILWQAVAQDADQDTMSSSLAPPEASLEVMMASEAGVSKSALKDTTLDVAKNTPILQIEKVYGDLSSPGVEGLDIGELQAMARHLDRAAKSLEDLGIDQAGQIRQASEYLMAEEPQAAREVLETVMPEM